MLLKQGYDRTIQFAKLSVLINAVMALGKIGLGLYSRSFFTGVHGLYNLGIGLAKVIAVKGYTERDKPGGADIEALYYYWVGVIILISSLLYMIYCVGMLIFARSNTQYTVYMGISVAAVTFSEIAVAVHGIVKTKRDNELIVEAIKMTNFVTSIISLVLTQTAILSFSYEGDATRLIGACGLAIGGISACTGLIMMLSKRKIASSVRMREVEYE